MQLIRLTFEDHMTMLSLDHGVSTSRESDFPFVLFMYLFVCLFRNSIPAIIRNDLTVGLNHIMYVYRLMRLEIRVLYLI